VNEGAGTTTTDLSLNANNGTLMGGTQWQVTTSCFASAIIQKTYVPDDIFENYLETNGMGDGIALNDSVFTSAIDTVTFLDMWNLGISDLTGIEDFTNLLTLECPFNNLSSIDISNNLSLTNLSIANNQLTQLDVSNNILLEYFNCAMNQLTTIDLTYNLLLSNLHCHINQLTSLDLSNNSLLDTLSCFTNQLTNLDVTNNFNLIDLTCGDNNLISLDLSNNTNLLGVNAYNNNFASIDVRNGNNQNMTTFSCTYNLNLTCIDVDDAAWSTANWTVVNGNIDAQHYFSTNCNATAIDETKVSEKELLKITDILGRKVLGNSHQPLFYIYNDRSVEKKIIIE
jgi:hypothetical protein